MASYFSRPKPMGSMNWWQPAQGCCLACADIRSRLVCGLSSFTGGKLLLTPGGGSGTFWHRNCSRTKTPRDVGDVSFGLLVRARNVAWPIIPARSELVGKSTRAYSAVGVATP